MSWAARRRFIILLIVGAVAIALLTVLFTTIFYTAPSCSDGVQNQDETGIDCGGSCAYLCSAELQPPTVLFTKALGNGVGRTDIIASVENKNAAAAKNVSYSITLYGADRTIIQTVTGTFDLPPGATVPIYVPGVTSGKQVAARAFLTIEPSSLRWFSSSATARVIPAVSNPKETGTIDAPRVQAILANPSVAPLTNVRVVVLVRSAEGDVIAASQTVVPVIPAQGQATATFTWDSAFSTTTASIQVVPIIPL